MSSTATASIQYTADPAQLIRECHRVLKPGGTAIFMVYNRVSWLNALSKVMKVALEHEDAPVLKKFSIGEFRELLAPFSEVRDRSRALPGEVAAAQGLEGRGVQHDVRRHVQRPAAIVGAAARLAPDGVLQEADHVPRRHGATENLSKCRALAHWHLKDSPCLRVSVSRP